MSKLVLAALECYCGDNGYKMRTSSKTRASKSAPPLGNEKFV